MYGRAVRRKSFFSGKGSITLEVWNATSDLNQPQDFVLWFNETNIQRFGYMVQHHVGLKPTPKGTPSAYCKAWWSKSWWSGLETIHLVADDWKWKVLQWPGQISGLNLDGETSMSWSSIVLDIVYNFLHNNDSDKLETCAANNFFNILLLKLTLQTTK